MADIEKPLTAWHERLFAVLMALTDIELRGTGFIPDYSRDSLSALERHLLRRLDEPGQAALPGNRAFVEGAAAYLGEALMRVAGGAWTWPDADLGGPPGGLPVATADPAVGLAPVSPVRLLQEAATARDAARFTTVHDLWSRAVEEHRRAVPSWRPVKEQTEVDDPDPGAAPLARWLAARASAADAWARAYAPDEDWDFSPDSLSRLQELVRRKTPTKESLKDPANHDFREGAAWYLGEVLRRGVGGRWNHNPDGGDHPYLEALGPKHHTSMPFVALRIALRRDGYLRRHFDDLAR
ncbi:hypothetical protein [Phytomonospora endophytica]|uniref:Uncharacterized protein n=1 Tax=Phytomonospora endophytica TaxID=714109 RepID=A0A841F6R3_9ACTN|nr:hypothetical protein [Phytomonospora endophytica]MBB6032651.1 hypothetical protein [Phytomonospora endophytica]GIG66199.1 hypothetical protein Pen01_24940 [Phytomonospora endophytica]